MADNKCNFKVSIKGSCEENGESKLLNMDYIGDGVVAIVIQKTPDGAGEHVQANIVGKFSLERMVYVIKELKTAWGKGEFAKALLMEALECMAAEADNDDSDDDEDDGDE